VKTKAPVFLAANTLLTRGNGSNLPAPLKAAIEAAFPPSWSHLGSDNAWTAINLSSLPYLEDRVGELQRRRAIAATRLDEAEKRARALLNGS